MNCRRVTIEMPGSDRFISVNVAEFPDTPPQGARIQISYIGANFGKAEIEEVIEKLGRLSTTNPRGSSSSGGSRQSSFSKVTRYAGYKEGGFFAGQEIAGVINRIGDYVDEESKLAINQPVIVYPYDGISNVVKEILAVDDIKNLIPIPKGIPLSVACTFPCGGLLSMFAVSSICRILNLLAIKVNKTRAIKIMVVGTGGLSLWTLSLLQHFMRERKDIKIYVCSSNDLGLSFVQLEYPNVEIIQWPEEMPEANLVERVANQCNGFVDVIVNYGTTERILKRCLNCLNEGGYLYINDQAAEVLMSKFIPIAHSKGKHIDAVHIGTIEQLKELVHLVETGKVRPPPREIFTLEEGPEALRKLANNEFLGRAVLQFNRIND